MKIQDNNSLHGPSGTGVGGPDRANSTDAVQSGSARRNELRTTDGDHVQLSGLSQILQNSGAERLYKVDALQAAYQAGKYKPDAAAVAGKIIDEALNTLRGTE